MSGPKHRKHKQLTLEDFFVDGTFRTKGVYGLRSMNDGEHYTVLENNGTRIVKYSYKTGLPVATLLDLKTLEDSPVSRIDDYTFNADESRILICTNKKPIYRRSFTADPSGAHSKARLNANSSS